MTRVAVAGVSLLVVAVAGLPAQGRMPWWPVAAREFSFQLLRPDLDEGGLSFASFMLYPRVRAPISPSVAAVAELPYARFAADGGGASATVLGNPYIGLDFTAPGGLEGAWGVRFALATESRDFGSGNFLAALADFDRFEAWIEETWTLTARIGHRSTSPGGFQPGFTVGLTVFRPNASGADTEAFADYRLSAAYREARFSTAAEFTGRYLVTQDGDLSELTVHQLALGMGAEFGRVWPTVAIRVPLDDDLTGLLDWVTELGMVVPF